MKNSALWEELEAELEAMRIRYGEVVCVIKIHNGVPISMSVKEPTRTIRGETTKVSGGGER